MLKYFYLICLLICINTTLSYDSRSNLNPHKVGRSRRFKKSKGIDGKEFHPRAVEEVQDAEQQFDVAGFVQQALDDDENYELTIKKGRSSNNDDYETGGSNFNYIKKEKRQNYLNIGGDSPSELNINSPVFKYTVKPEYQNINTSPLDTLKNPRKFRHNIIRNAYRDYSAIESGQKKNPTKKCAFSNLRIPFFSRNKSQPVTPKKNKKRKIFCLNSLTNSKKDTDGTLKKVGEYQVIPMKVKRSYNNLCSFCRKRLIRNAEIGEDQKTSTIIHNSRQFFQNIDNVGHKQLNLDNEETLDSNIREKREEEDKERQLKELEEVQRKIDAVEIQIPSFDRKPEE